jgi:putative flavoprotein involved in K+ transport
MGAANPPANRLVPLRAACMSLALPEQDPPVPAEQVETLIVGGGQAGLMMSAQLRARGRPHLILERTRIAERWRTERWDALHANGPAWHDRFPDLTIAGVDPDGFATRDQMVDYFTAYAAHIAAPIRCGVAVTALHRAADGTFHAETSAGPIEAGNVVAATGPFQRGAIPPLVPPDPGLLQIHSTAYRNPGQLPPGAVLVVGAGSSGTQIADELQRAGRRVFLCVGQHERPPRRYRGKDFCFWLGVLGLWDAETRDPAKEHVTIAVSGAYGGQTIDFRRLATRGITLLGRAEAFADGVLRIAPDLARDLAAGDANYLELLDAADAYAARVGLDLPEEPAARVVEPEPSCVTTPIRQLDLRAEGIGTIIWATGFGFDFSWLKAGALDRRGAPVHRLGITEVPGLYVLGLPFLSRRASSFIFGVERDAARLAEHIAGRG